MYAVFRSGGKQYRATPGERLRLEKLEVEVGSDVSFDEVLLVGEGAEIKVGSPYLTGTTVSGTVLKQGKSRKVNVVKFRRRKNYLRQHTHRQFFTVVEITDISADGKVAATKPAAEAKPAAKKKATKKAAPKKPAAKKKATKKAAGKKVAKKAD